MSETAERTYVVTLADDAGSKHYEEVGGGGGVDHEPDLRDLSLKSDPVVRREFKAYPGKLDHVHLSRASGTNLIRWWGRASDGYHYPFGAVMEVVFLKKKTRTSKIKKSVVDNSVQTV